MALNNAALVVGSNAIAATITHVQLHSTDSGPGWTTNTVGSRIAVTPAVATAGDITIDVTGTGLPASTAVDGISYWDASTGGNNKGGAGGANFTGDATTNASGEYNVAVTENVASS